MSGERESESEHVNHGGAQSSISFHVLGLRKGRRLNAGQVVGEAELREVGRETEPPFAQVRWSAETPGGYAFALYAADSPELICSVRSEQADVYDVFGADGVQIGRLERRRGRILPWPRRLRWTLAVGPEGWTCVGKKGSGLAWSLYVLLAPLWIPVWVALCLFTLLDGDTDFNPGIPRRMRWFGSNGGLVLDGQRAHMYRIPAGGIDRRVAYAVSLVASK